mmetsp:Transcript_79331/g.224568  ORF Transcript_79331/g.224568 Transcript_79331/m.224568 type:complete len:232 (+) Transcript_79331:51-746(+)
MKRRNCVPGDFSADAMAQTMAGAIMDRVMGIFDSPPQSEPIKNDAEDDEGEEEQPTAGSDSSTGMPKRDGKDGTVKLHIAAKELNGSVGTFRDAHVQFEERQVIVRVVDRGGHTYTLRSAKLPGPISTTESRFQMSKTGEDLSITLKKAHVEDKWFQEEAKSAASKAEAPAVKAEPAVIRAEASARRRTVEPPVANGGKAKSLLDAGDFIGRGQSRRQDDIDKKQLGLAFI